MDPTTEFQANLAKFESNVDLLRTQLRQLTNVAETASIDFFNTAGDIDDWLGIIKKEIPEIKTKSQLLQTLNKPLPVPQEEDMGTEKEA